MELLNKAFTKVCDMFDVRKSKVGAILVIVMILLFGLFGCVVKPSEMIETRMDVTDQHGSTTIYTQSCEKGDWSGIYGYCEENNLNNYRTMILTNTKTLYCDYSGTVYVVMGYDDDSATLKQDGLTCSSSIKKVSK